MLKFDYKDKEHWGKSIKALRAFKRELRKNLKKAGIDDEVLWMIVSDMQKITSKEAFMSLMRAVKEALWDYKRLLMKAWLALNGEEDYVKRI